MNKVELRLTRDDIEKAILEYVKTKYPSLKIDAMLIAYNKHNQVVEIIGYLK